jgi:dihydroorotate dehydrogenase (fumarate)
MNLATTYLGLSLKNPLVVGASPFCDNLAACTDLEAAGAAAIVMHSLFEEQVDLESRAMIHHLEAPGESYAEATSYFPNYDDYQLRPEQYLRQLDRLATLVKIPVIASLNGRRMGGWIDYAQRMESAGAAAIELNLYQVATDPTVTGEQIEAEVVEIVRAVTSSVKIPVAVKLSPYHTSLAHFASTLAAAGAAGLVLFNRFYQPDFDIEDLAVVPQLRLSDSSELLLRLRWLAILSPELRASLACSGGVHRTEDVVKALLAGAHAVQLVSVLLKQGPRYLATLLAGLQAWMKDHGYDSVEELRGAMDLRRCPDAGGHERANYIQILQSWKI